MYMSYTARIQNLNCTITPTKTLVGVWNSVLESSNTYNETCLNEFFAVYMYMVLYKFDLPTRIIDDDKRDLQNHQGLRETTALYSILFY